MLKKFAMLTLVLFLFGCANMKGEPREETVYEPVSAPPETEADTSQYYDFEDIPIPREMKINPQESILFESGNMRSGMLNFSGRVDSDSLFNYFQVSMKNEGWRLLNSIKYGTYMLAFDKSDKICIIRIVPRKFSSELQVWISPKMSNP